MSRSLENIISKCSKNLPMSQLIEKGEEICKDLGVDFSLRLKELIYSLEDERIRKLTPSGKDIRNMTASKKGLAQFEKFVEEKTRRMWKFDKLKELWEIVKLKAYPKYRASTKEYQYKKKDKYGKFKCEHCKKRINQPQMQVDHIIPVSYGGPTKDWNLKILCRKCHGRKGQDIWVIL